RDCTPVAVVQRKAGPPRIGPTTIEPSPDMLVTWVLRTRSGMKRSAVAGQATIRSQQTDVRNFNSKLLLRVASETGVLSGPTPEVRLGSLRLAFEQTVSSGALCSGRVTMLPEAAEGPSLPKSRELSCSR